MSFMISTLFQITVMSSVMISIILLLKKMIGKHLNPMVLGLLWLVVLVRLIFPITFVSPISVYDIFPQQISEQTSSQDTATYDGNMAPLNAEQGKTLVEKTTLLLDNTYLQSALIAVWALGVVIVLTVQIRRIFLLNRKLKLCKEVQKHVLVDVLENFKRRLSLMCKIRILACDVVKTPATCGLLKPCILMPSVFIQSENCIQNNVIILHELCHIMRADILLKYVWLFAKALYWFNPLVWVANKQSNETIELCCDQKALKIIGDKKRLDYGQTLLDIAKKTKANKLIAVTSSLCEGKFALKGRILRIVSPQKTSIHAGLLSIFIALIMIVTCFTSICLPVPKEKITPSNGSIEKTVQQQETAGTEEVGATVLPTTTDETYLKTQGTEQAIIQTTPLAVSNIAAETTVNELPATNDKIDPKAQVTEQPTAQTTAIVISEVSIEKPYAKIQVTAETTVRTAAETTASVIPNK